MEEKILKIIDKWLKNENLQNYLMSNHQLSNISNLPIGCQLSLIMEYAREVEDYDMDVFTYYDNKGAYYGFSLTCPEIEEIENRNYYMGFALFLDKIRLSNH